MLRDKLRETGLDRGKQISKAVIAAIVLTLMLCLFSALMLHDGVKLFAKESYESQQNIAESIDETYSLLLENEQRARINYYQNLEYSAEMTAVVLKSYLNNGEYSGPYIIDKGFVVHEVNGDFELPAGIRIDMDAVDTKSGARTTTTMTDWDGEHSIDAYVVDLGSGYYYIDWETVQESMDFIRTYCNTDKAMKQAEGVLSGSILINKKNAERSYALYFSDDLAEIDEDILANFDMEMTDANHIFRYKDKAYSVAMSDLSTPYDLYFFTQEEDFLAEPSRWVSLFVVFTVVILITVVTWNLAVQKMVRERVLTSAQERFYKPKHMIIVNLVLCILTTSMLFGLCIFSQSLNSLYESTIRGNSILAGIKVSIEQEKESRTLSKEEKDSWLEYFAEQAGRLLSFDMDKANEELLLGISDAIDAEYIILYDGDGNEVCASNGHVGYTLNSSAEMTEDDFRLLLNGVNVIRHETEYDPVARKQTRQFGARVPYDNKFGAVIVAFKEDENSEAGAQVEAIIRSVKKMNGLAMIADKESGLITRSSDKRLIGYAPEAIGIDEENAFVDSYNIGGVKYYGVTGEGENEKLYYFMGASSIVRQSIKFSFGCSVLFAFMYAVIYLIIRIGYTQKYFDESVLIGKPVAKGAKIQVQMADGRTKRTTEASRRYVFVPKSLVDMQPEQLALFVFDAMLALILLNTWIGIRSGRFSENESLIGFILQGNWTKGANLFAATSIFLMVIEFSFGLLLLKILTSLLCLALDTKGETICRLAFNIIRYFAIIAMLYFAFTYLGFNTSGLLASVSFLTLAISIGSKDLVADILAGITIVFEGDYQVGDMVDIGGYRGQVQEIGVRSTKLIGRGDNVKIINNRDVKNVLNMTRLNSWYPVEVRIPRTQPLDVVEAMLKEELPKIGERNKEIISGPYYYGILKMEKDSVTLSILAECREENYHHVQRLLNKELYNLFKSNEIPLA